ncbi:nucleotidase YfbR, HD superfamily [Lachnospiraceae bacterium KM106-2]|nr:nucleotidase YfbR, HD superfamily [Lachnospiraceae bacterium KM106-2]
MQGHFFAMMSRMKYIERWALMRNSREENISEHSLEVSMIAHGLAIIAKKRLHKEIDPSKVALMGMYHDCTEIITGDMPTPIKYYNDEIKQAYKEIEEVAAKRLLSMIPDDLSSEYEELFLPKEEDAYLWSLVKAADRISALIKCIEEKNTGNKEFVQAEQTIKHSLLEMKLEEVDIFIQEYMGAYDLTLDELN